MAQENVCDYNKYGFCKYRLTCRRMHIMEKCCETNCEIKKCRQRHPRICRYWRDIGYCKFGQWCLFKHEGVNKSDDEVKELSSKIDAIEQIINEKSKLIESLEKVISESMEGRKDEPC